MQTLDAVDTATISVGGTDIAGALAEAEQAFSVDNNYKIMVLITDGEELESSAIDYAQSAQAAAGFAFLRWGSAVIRES